MNMIERQNLEEILDQYIEEVAAEHADKQICNTENCISCAKSQVASAIWSYLELASGVQDTALF